MVYMCGVGVGTGNGRAARGTGNGGRNQESGEKRDRQGEKRATLSVGCQVRNGKESADTHRHTFAVC